MIHTRPEQRGLTPSYEQRAFDASSSEGRWQLIASHDGRDGSLTVYQDISLRRAQLEAGRELTYELNPQRFGWLQVMTGQVELNELTLAAGYGAAISHETKLLIRASASSELLLFDLN